KYQPQCNWLQSLEGDIDSSHVNYLHSILADAKHLGRISEEARARLKPGQGRRTPLNQRLYADNAPRMEVVDTDIGTMYAAQRTVDDGSYYYRVTQLIFPFVTNIAPQNDRSAGMVKVWVPMDDYHTMVWEIHYNLDGAPLSDEEREGMRRGRIPSTGFLPNTSDWLGDWKFVSNMSNDFQIDRERQKTWNYT